MGDPMAMLNKSMEERTGVADGDIDAFLAKVSATEQLIKGMKDGSVDPHTVRVPGQLTEEEKRERDEKRRKREEERARRREEERLLAKAEEREKWWGHAELVYGERGERTEKVVDAAETEERVNRIAAAYTQRDANDYSQWANWEPKDPVTLEEQAEQEAMLEKMKDAEFEKMNPDFCKQYKEDIEERTRNAQTKKHKAVRLKTKGNALFKKRCFTAALEKYAEGLALDNFHLPLLTNMAQAHLRLGNLEDTIEFCDRALHVNPKCVKALSRRAAVRRKQGELDRAVADLELAVEHDRAAAASQPGNSTGGNTDLLRELEEVRALQREQQLEQAVESRATEAKGSKELNELSLLQVMVRRLKKEVSEQYNEGDVAAAESDAADDGKPGAAAPPLPPGVHVTGAIVELLDVAAAGAAVAGVNGAVADHLRVFMRTSGALDLLVRRLAPRRPTAIPDESSGDAPALDPSPSKTMAALRLACAGDERNRKLMCTGSQGGVSQALGLMSTEGSEALSSGTVTAAEIRQEAVALLRTCSDIAQCRRKLAKSAEALQTLLEMLFDWDKPEIVRDAAALVKCIAGDKPDSNGSGGVAALVHAPIDAVAALSAALASDLTDIDCREQLVTALAQLTLDHEMRERFASLALVGTTGDEDGSDADDADVADASQTPVAVLLDVVRRRTPADTVAAKELALAALMNAACEPSGSVRTQLVSAGGIVPMLAVLDPSQRRGLSDVAVVRAAGVLSRAATVTDAMPIFQARSTMERLIQAVGKTGIKNESLADELHAHIVRVVAAVIQSVELVTMFAELGGVQKLLSLLPEPRFEEVKTREHAARVTAAKARDVRNANMIGNLATVLAKCVTDPSGAASALVVEQAGVERLLTVLRDGKQQGMRKNVAICIAKLSRNARGNEILRAHHGMEMLREMSGELGV